MSVLDDWFGVRLPPRPVLPEIASEITIKQASGEVVIRRNRRVAVRLVGADAAYAAQALQDGRWHPKLPNSRNGATQYWVNR